MCKHQRVILHFFKGLLVSFVIGLTSKFCIGLLGNLG